MRDRITPFVVVALVAACDPGLPAGRQPHVELNYLDMGNQPRQKPQRGDLFGGNPTGMLAPPPGTVARGHPPYLLGSGDADAEGAALLENPTPRSPEAVARGRFVFENVCITCHGPEAAGDGHLTAVFPKPPSLMTQRVRDWPDGRIFHVPMRGQGSMPRHSRQLEPRQIWDVIHYLRDLQSRLPVAPPPPAADAKGGAA
ncbi:MAG: cytochrome c [Deltaproteobacteria bacterium]|nr:cytochrome c [Deltaproteobacteria bacterium]